MLVRFMTITTAPPASPSMLVADTKGPRTLYRSGRAGGSGVSDWIDKPQATLHGIQDVLLGFQQREVSGGGDTPRSSHHAGPRDSFGLSLKVDNLSYICLFLGGGVGRRVGGVFFVNWKNKSERPKLPD